LLFAVSLVLAGSAFGALLSRAEKEEAIRSCQEDHVQDACSLVKCNNGKYDLCLAVGLRWKRDRALEALPLFEKACKGGVLGACVEAGVIYMGLSPNSPTNPTKAQTHFKKACDGGEERSCRFQETFLGTSALTWTGRRTIYLEQCRGTVRGDRTGEKAVPGACMVAAWYYLNGYGVAEDRTRACEWIRRGCEKGSGSACKEQKQRCR
jgi:TPR repeat protein